MFLPPDNDPEPIEELMMSKAILINAPADTGKTVVMKHLQQKGYNLHYRSCKDHLHTLTREFFCVEEGRYWEVYNTRELKEKPQCDFRIKFNAYERSKLEEFFPEWMLQGTSINLTIREAMIYVSEVLCKPRFGRDYFGKVRASRVYEAEGMNIIDDSTSSFLVDGDLETSEVVPLIDKIGDENILLIRVHREGYTFEGDSRNYVPDGVVTNTVDVYNNSTLQEFLDAVEGYVSKFLEG